MGGRRLSGALKAVVGLSGILLLSCATAQECRLPAARTALKAGQAPHYLIASPANSLELIGNLWCLLAGRTFLERGSLETANLARLTGGRTFRWSGNTLEKSVRIEDFGFRGQAPLRIDVSEERPPDSGMASDSPEMVRFKIVAHFASGNGQLDFPALTALFGDNWFRPAPPPCSPHARVCSPSYPPGAENEYLYRFAKSGSWFGAGIRLHPDGTLERIQFIHFK